MRLVVAGAGSVWSVVADGEVRLTERAAEALRRAVEAPSALAAVGELRTHALVAQRGFIVEGRYMEPELREQRLSANAEYRPLDNSLVVNAGLTMLLSAGRSPVGLRATAGFIIGHELSHSIDSNGIWFDEFGTPRPFATPAETRRALRRFSCFVRCAQLAGVDGVRTLNENFADGMGLRAAAAAANISDLAEAEDFVISFGELWCGLGTSEADPHAPPALRPGLAMLQSTEARLCGRREATCPVG